MSFVILRPSYPPSKKRILRLNPLNFYNTLLRRRHWISWHKYNLKRKIADLAPLNAEQFAQKVLGNGSFYYYYYYYYYFVETG